MFILIGTMRYLVTFARLILKPMKYLMQAGSDAQRNTPICCRNFADHTGAIVEPAGPPGKRKCDPPYVLGNSMLDALKAIAPSAKFSLLTGDIVERKLMLTLSCMKWLDIIFRSLRGYLARQQEAIIGRIFGSVCVLIHG